MATEGSIVLLITAAESSRRLPEDTLMYMFFELTQFVFIVLLEHFDEVTLLA